MMGLGEPPFVVVFVENELLEEMLDIEADEIEPSGFWRVPPTPLLGFLVLGLGGGVAGSGGSGRVPTLPGAGRCCCCCCCSSSSCFCCCCCCCILLICCSLIALVSGPATGGAGRGGALGVTPCGTAKGVAGHLICGC